MGDYDTDFYRWTQTQAAALRAKDFATLDLENLAEEIESLGRSDRRAIVSHLERLGRLRRVVDRPRQAGAVRQQPPGHRLAHRVFAHDGQPYDKPTHPGDLSGIHTGYHQELPAR
jgi:Domain of unknown function DUF29